LTFRQSVVICRILAWHPLTRDWVEEEICSSVDYRMSRVRQTTRVSSISNYMVLMRIVDDLGIGSHHDIHGQHMRCLSICLLNLCLLSRCLLNHLLVTLLVYLNDIHPHTILRVIIIQCSVHYENNGIIPGILSLSPASP